MRTTPLLRFTLTRGKKMKYYGMQWWPVYKLYGKSGQKWEP